MDVFDLSATLSLDTSKYESGLNGAASMAKGIGSKIGTALKTATLVTGALAAAGAAVTGAFVSSARKTADFGDKVDKMSQKLGLSTDAYQKWDYVLNLAGTEMSSMTTGLKTLTNKIDDAKNGGAGAQEMFDKLGISMDELNKMSREEVFEATIKGFQGMEDSTERAALANDLFGRSGQNLTPLFNQTAKQTEEQIQLAEKYGMVMPEAAVKASAAFNDSLTTMQMTFTGLKNRMMGEFLPAMTQVTDGMAKLFAGDDSGAEDVAAGIEGIVTKVAEVLPKVIQIAGNIALKLGEAFIKNLQSKLGGGNLVDAFSKGVDMVVENVPSMIENFAQSFADNAPIIAEQGTEMILKLGEGLVKALPQLISAAGQIVNGLLRVFVGIPALLLAKGLGAAGKFALGLLKGANKIATAAGKWVSGAVKGLASLPGKLAGEALKAISSFVGKIASGAGKVLSTAKNLATGAVNAIRNGFANLGDVGMNLVRGIWNGISNGYSWITGQIRSWVGNVKNFIKNLFGIASPSKWARDVIGLNIDKGLALGIEQNSDVVDDAVDSLLPDITSRSLTSTVGGSGSAKFSYPVFNNNIEVNGAEDPEQWAGKFMDRLQMEARMA